MLAGLSEKELNRLKYGWSDPSSKETVEKFMNAHSGSPITFGEALLTITKLSFGSDYDETKMLKLTKVAFQEIIGLVTLGAMNGCIIQKASKVTPDQSKTYHRVRSEFSRLLREDKRFRNFTKGWL